MATGIVKCLLFHLSAFLFTCVNMGRAYYIFNVVEYGAIADGKTNNAKAFVKAWREACNCGSASRVVVPAGVYMLSQVVFEGPCTAPISFHSSGNIKAYPYVLDTHSWINFRYVDRLFIAGGSIHGQGSYAWSQNTCSTGSCRLLPYSLGLDFVTNSRVSNMELIDSKNTHMNIFSCANISVTRLTISAPEESPNTDGIRIGSSTRVRLSTLLIGTGDDCISMLSGNQDLRIHNVWCGPGHGISVGSLGRYKNEEDFKGLRVTNCTFDRTTNGVRIKTWASRESKLSVAHLLFQDIEMRRVSNPIIVDQEYCPYPPCFKIASQIQISSITFRRIRGVSTTQNAVTLRCSSTYPCRNINMEDIDLRYGGAHSSSLCINAQGYALGYQNPPPCL